jgi:hypothetical protein
MDWAYLTQEEAQRTIEPNTLIVSSDMSLRKTLWEQRAKDFSINDISTKEDSKPIVVLLVGCLAKHSQGLWMYTTNQSH